MSLRNSNPSPSALPALPYSKYDGMHLKMELTSTIFTKPRAVALIRFSAVPFLWESPEFGMIICLYEFCLIHDGTIFSGFLLWDWLTLL